MTETLIATSTVDAPAGAVFTVLADPTTHQDIDGTGWVRQALDGEGLTAVGQIFRMAMYHDNLPNKHYKMANRVVAIEPDRVIAWEPGLVADDGSADFGGWTWRYDLLPVGDDRTEVTLTYDWSRVPATIRENIAFPPFPASHLENSLANLARLAAVTSTT